MSPIFIVFYMAPIVLVGYAAKRGDGSLRHGLTRAFEQFIILVPRVVCALVAAGFIVQLIPRHLISQYLSDGSPWIAILIGSVTGLIIPSGPVVIFSMAASFANAGASKAALVAFITSWTIFALHRVVIYEIPLLGPSFVKLRLFAASPMPLLAGLFVVLAGWVLGLTT